MITADGLNAPLGGACAVLVTDLSGGNTKLASQVAGHAAAGRRTGDQ